MFKKIENIRSTAKDRIKLDHATRQRQSLKATSKCNKIQYSKWIKWIRNHIDMLWDSKTAADISLFCKGLIVETAYKMFVNLGRINLNSWLFENHNFFIRSK